MSKRDLSNVTLLTVNCLDPDLAAFMLERCMQGFKFGSVKLLSHAAPAYSVPGVTWVEIPALQTIHDYNLFAVEQLHHYVDTPFSLTVHTDGFILRPDLWQDEFLAYDYIGAPWPKNQSYSRLSQVGNSGFCLRSQRLLKLGGRLARSPLLRQTIQQAGLHDDVFYCSHCFPLLRAAGMKFAPLDLAAKFSCEQYVAGCLDSTGETFGFHGYLTDVNTRHVAGLLRESAQRLPNRPTLRLAINYYVDDFPPRRQELDECLQRNMASGLFSELFVFTGPGVPLPSSSPVPLHQLDYTQLSGGHSSGRPTFSQMFQAINALTSDDDITVLANNDIYFDDTASLFHLLLKTDFYALSRWDDTLMWNVNYGQDVWAFRGPCEIVADFPQGFPGCDNRLAYEAQKAGYRVLNPAKSLVAHHQHQSNFRRYPATDTSAGCKLRIPYPYLHISPHRLGENPKMQLMMKPTIPLRRAVVRHTKPRR